MDTCHLTHYCYPSWSIDRLFYPLPFWASCHTSLLNRTTYMLQACCVSLDLPYTEVLSPFKLVVYKSLYMIMCDDVNYMYWLREDYDCVFLLLCFIFSPFFSPFVIMTLFYILQEGKRRQFQELTQLMRELLDRRRQILSKTLPRVCIISSQMWYIVNYNNGCW